MRGVLLMVVILSINCIGGYVTHMPRRAPELIGKDKLVGFEVRLERIEPIDTVEFLIDPVANQTTATQAFLKLTNHTPYMIQVDLPESEETAYPGMSNDNGPELNIRAHIRWDYRHLRTFKLPSGKSVETKFHLYLEDCFDFSGKGIYDLWFEYMGMILDSTGTRISDDVPLKSNVLKIITQ